MASALWESKDRGHSGSFHLGEGAEASDSGTVELWEQEESGIFHVSKFCQCVLEDIKSVL